MAAADTRRRIHEIIVGTHRLLSKDVQFFRAPSPEPRAPSPVGVGHAAVSVVHRFIDELVRAAAANFA